MDWLFTLIYRLVLIDIYIYIYNSLIREWCFEAPNTAGKGRGQMIHVTDRCVCICHMVIAGKV